MNRLVAVAFLALSATAFAQSVEMEFTQVDSQSSYDAEVRVEQGRREGHWRRHDRGDRRRPRPPAPPAPQEMNAESFWQLQQAIERESFQDDKLKVLGAAAPYSLFTVSQVGQILDLFPFGEDKVKALRTLNPRILDHANGFQLFAHFRFDDEKEAARQILAQP
jgi:hypothetical protein